MSMERFYCGCDENKVYSAGSEDTYESQAEQTANTQLGSLQLKNRQ